jgi:uncharacterized protein YbaP (TraB family)
MRRRLARVVLATCLACLGLAAQNAAAEAAGPAIWEFSGQSATIRLLGSVHVLRESDYPLPALVTKALGQAECLVFELDLDDLDPIESQTLLLSLGRLGEGRTLHDVMGANDYRRAAEESMKLGIDLNLFSEVRPWLAALTIMNTQFLKLGFLPQLGLDQQLAAMAAADGKEIIGLETLEFQLGLFAGLSDRMQSELLLQTLDEASLLEAQMGDLVTAWRQGRTTSLAAELGRSFADYPELYRRLVTDRNADWIDRIIDLASGERDCLVVVGALHLVGTGSVIDLLRKRGVDVRLWTAGSEPGTTVSPSQISTISKSSLPAPQSGQRHVNGTSSHGVPGEIPDSGSPSSS